MGTFGIILAIMYLVGLAANIALVLVSLRSGRWQPYSKPYLALALLTWPWIIGGALLKTWRER